MRSKNLCKRELIYYLFSTLLIAVYIMRVFTHSGLALDGSAGILGLVINEEIQYIRGREFEEFLNQAPTVLLIKAGISSITSASYLLGLTVFGIPTALWIYSLKLSMVNNFRFFLVLVAVLTQVLFSSNFFLPSMLANAVGLLIVLLLVSEENLSRSQSWLLLGLAVVAIRLYETMMLFSLLGIVITIVAMRKKEMIIPVRFKLATLLALCASLLSSAHGLLYPVHQANLGSGIDLNTIMFHSPFKFFVVTLAVIVSSLFIAIHFPSNIFLNLTSGLALILCILFVTDNDFQMGATSHWYLRSSVALVVIICAALIAVFHFFKIKSGDRKLTIYPVFALVATFTFIVTANSAIGWNNYLYLIENTVNRAPGVMTYGELHATEKMDKVYSGSWSTSYMSMVLRYGPNAGVIQNAFPEQVSPDHDADNLVLVFPVYDKSFPYWRQ